VSIDTGWRYNSPRNGDLFTANSHMRRLRVTFDGGGAGSFERDVAVDQQEVVLNVDATARTVRVTALDVYPGTRWADLCISEISIEGQAAPHAEGAPGG